jgi:hypothetical protein
MIIKTPVNKIEVELKDFITGREGEEIDKPIMDVRFKIGTSGQGNAEINVGEAIKKSTEIAVGIVVLSVDGKKEDILNSVLDLPKKDYKFVLDNVDKIVRGEDFTKP